MDLVRAGHVPVTFVSMKGNTYKTYTVGCLEIIFFGLAKAHALFK
jgi:hypothetical protein